MSQLTIIELDESDNHNQSNTKLSTLSTEIKILMLISNSF